MISAFLAQYIDLTPGVAPVAPMHSGVSTKMVTQITGDLVSALPGLVAPCLLLLTGFANFVPGFNPSTLRTGERRRMPHPHAVARLP